MTACWRTPVVFSTLLIAGLAAQTAPSQVLWTFDRLDEIGGVKTTVEGNPKVVETPFGRAIEFDGVDDGVWIEKHPLAGAATFTFEAIFRPDGGAARAALAPPGGARSEERSAGERRQPHDGTGCRTRGSSSRFAWSRTAGTSTRS